MSASSERLKAGVNELTNQHALPSMLLTLWLSITNSILPLEIEWCGVGMVVWSEVQIVYISGVTSHRQPWQCRGAQGPKMVKAAQSPELCIETVIRLCTAISQNHHPCLLTLPFVANVCRRGDYSYATGLHMVQLMPLHPKTPSSLASLNSRTVLPFWYWLTKLSSKESVKLVLLNCCSYWQRSAAQTWRASCWCRLC